MNMPFGKNDHIKMIEAIAMGLKAAKSLNRYLELGTKTGACFNIIAPFAQEAYTVDILDSYKYIKHNKNLVWFNGTTTDFLKAHDKNEKFDLVFIDANHKHKASLSDFELVLPLVNNNGLILLHDTYPTCEELLSTSYCGDTYKTAMCIRKDFSNVCEIATLPFYFGISIVRKLDRQLLWKRHF